MIILGEKYNFTNEDLKILNTKFHSVKKVKYADNNSLELINTLKRYIQNSFDNILVLNTKADLYDSLIKYIVELKLKEEIKIYTIEEFLEKFLYKVYIPDEFSYIHHLKRIKPYNSFQYIQKRAIDYLLSIPILLTLPFIYIITKIKVNIESPGRVFFIQNRVGKNGKKFECIKLRTMHEHNCNSLIKTATQDDKRIYPWGRTLRRLRLDETPQVINVLKGEMHLIGPRAEWDKLVQEYEKKIPYYHLRHIVAPGITGWAQVIFVEGKSKDDTKQKLMYDLYYIKHWNLWLELKTIWKTILVILGRRGI